MPKQIYTPKVTVLMSVYNGEKYLPEAVDSILNQTFEDFQFLIIDDGSTDSSLEILRFYNDSRIRIIENKINIGLIKSLNKGLKLAKSKYIARMDADDISMPLRLEKQVALMDSHPEIGVCGTWVEAFYGETSIWEKPREHDSIFAGMLFDNMVNHPTVIIRMDAVSALKAYYEDAYIHAEDYEYWIRLLLSGVRFTNIGEALLRHRVHEEKVSIVYNAILMKNTEKIRLKLLAYLGINPEEEEVLVHNIIANRRTSDIKHIERAAIWLNKIKEANNKKKVFSEPALEWELSQRWFELCYNSCALGPIVWQVFNQNPVPIDLNLRQKVKFFLKSMLSVGEKSR